MRASVYLGPYRVDLQEHKLPALGPRDVLLNVDACGVCGSDVASYLYGHHVSIGQVMGHEIAAHVAAVGEQIQGLAVEQQVAVRPMRACGSCAYCRSDRAHLCGETVGRSLGYGTPGGYAEQVLFADATIGSDLIPVPNGLSSNELVWAEPLSVAVHAIGRIGPSTHDRLLVLGAGSVGLCVVAAAFAAGWSQIVVAEPREPRRNAAASLGAQTVELVDLSPSELFAAAIDTSGVSSVIAAAVEHVLPGGRVVLVGLGDGPLPLPSAGVELVASFAYTDADFRLAVDHLVSGRVRLGSFVTHHFSLAATAEAISASATDLTLVKAVVLPQQQEDGT